MFRKASVALALLGTTVLAVAPAAYAASQSSVSTAKLRGAALVPGPGDPDGRGSATVVAIPSENQICFHLVARRIEPATGAHIHKGGPDENGPVVVTLEPPSDGSSDGCVDVRSARVDDIAANPGNYYVNIHNHEFHDGAIRGQLG